MERAPPRLRRHPPNPRPPRRGGRGRPSPPPPAPSRNSPRVKNRRRRPDRERLPPLPSVTIKLIVRRLPPMLTAQAFAQVADPLGAEKAIWRAFTPGSASEAGGLKRARHVNRHGVAYLGFASWVDAGAFADAFNGFRFAEEGDAASNYIARVERAMSQAVPPLHKRKPLQIEATIGSDPDYLKFVQGLEEEGRREMNRAGALSVSQTSAMFPGKGGGVERESKSKGKGSGRITPLMEDVRAKRKERDQKKKTTKPASRPPRVKGRPIVVTAPSKNDAAVKAVAAAKRKKVRRGEFSGPPKKIEEAMPIAKKGGRLGLNGRRAGVVVHPRDGRDHKPLNGTAHNPNFSVQYSGSNSSEMNGFGSSEKGPVGRGGRSRSARGGRSRGKPGSSIGQSARDGIRGTQDVVHGTVRLLRKETSNGNKT